MRRRAVGASLTRLPLNLLADLSASAPCALVERGPVCGRLYWERCLEPGRSRWQRIQSTPSVSDTPNNLGRILLGRPQLNGACAASWLTLSARQSR